MKSSPSIGSRPKTIFRSKTLETLASGKWLVLAIPLVFIFVMSFSISDELFRIDDQEEFRLVGESTSLLSLFSTDAFVFLRPIKNAIFFIFHLIAPFGIRWCHVLAIIICALSFFPVLSFFRCVLQSERQALAASAVWLFSPTLVSSVAWLSGVNIIVMVAFAASAIKFHDSAWHNDTFATNRIILSSAFVCLSLLSYECGVAIVPLLLLFDFFLRPKRLQTNKGLFVHSTYFTILFLYCILRFLFSAKLSADGFSDDTTRLQLAFSSPFFFVAHFLLWFWPFGRLCVFGSYHWGMIPVLTLCLCWILLVAAILFCFHRTDKNKTIKFCILFFIVGFAPTSNCLGFGNGPYEDYYLGLCSLGLSAGLVAVITKLSRTTGTWKWGAYATALLLIGLRILAGAETISWAYSWQSDFQIWKESVRNRPEFFPNKMMLALAFIDVGKFNDALQMSREVECMLNPDSRHMSTVFLIRAICELREGKDATKAFYLLDRSHKANPSNRTEGAWRYYRGRVFEDLLGDLKQAEFEYSQAAFSPKSNYGALHRLASILAKQGRTDEAIAIWNRILQSIPSDEEALWSLVMLYRRIGNPEEADRIETRLRRLNGQ